MSKKKRYAVIDIPDSAKKKEVKLKKAKEKITVIDPKEYKDEDVKPIGYAKSESCEFEDEVITAVDDCDDKIVGYLPVIDENGENHLLAVTKKSYPLILILLFGAILLLALVLGIGFATGAFGGSKDNGQPAESNSIVIADGDTYDGDISTGNVASDEDMRYIEFPGYSGVTITKGSVIDLVNPESNGVYFKYTITQGDDVIYETDYIKPGEKVVWEPENELPEPGEYALTFNVSTVSVETGEACNGASFAVTATVTG